MQEYKTAGSIIIDTIISEKWIIDALKIQKMYKNGKYYKQGINAAYITGIILLNTDYRLLFSDTQIKEIIMALMVCNIGATIASEDDYEAQVEETLAFLSTRTNNQNIINMVHDHFEKEDATGLYHKNGNELSKGTKLCIVSLGIERLLRNLNENNFDKEKIENIYMNREIFIHNMNKKYDREVVEIWKENIRKLIPEVEKTRIFLNRFMNIKPLEKQNLMISPIELVVDAILKNLWIKDFLIAMKKREDSFLFIHSLNTGIYAAFILLMGNNDIFLKGKIDIHDIVIGSVLHDIGYSVRETINHQYHLCTNLSEIENEICKWHIVHGKSIIEDYFKEKRIYNKDIILDVIENHHEYEDATGCLKRKIKNPAVKIVNLANAIDLQIYRLYEKNEKKIFNKIDTNYKAASEKFDAIIASNVIRSATNILNNVDAVIYEQ